jgi:hypothetical protein
MSCKQVRKKLKNETLLLQGCAILYVLRSLAIKFINNLLQGYLILSNNIFTASLSPIRYIINCTKIKESYQKT